MMVFCTCIAQTVVLTIFCLGFCLVGVGLMWTWSLFLHWSRNDEFVLGLKSVDQNGNRASNYKIHQSMKEKVCQYKLLAIYIKVDGNF